MTKIGVQNINEKTDLLRFNLPTTFSNSVLKKAEEIEKTAKNTIRKIERIDLTDKLTLTVDGKDTNDFDDALSIELKNNNYIVGIHISDAAHYIKKSDIIDIAACTRICSIYMPDKKIPMIPRNLSENICSLRKNKIRPAISTIVRFNSNLKIIGYTICPSIVKVDEQLNYVDIDYAIQHNNKVAILYNIAKKLTETRMHNGATNINLPEINVRFDNISGEQILERIDRESPGRILVTEMMILSNWLSANFLKKHKIPAIFRSQPEPRMRLFKNRSGSLFHNWMQRKMLRPLLVSTNADRHSGLGLDAYVTATSPIRRYSDLITQRQIKSILGIDKTYTKNEIKTVLQKITYRFPSISKIQFLSNRYWLLKHLENKIGKKEKAIVLCKKNNNYSVLIKTYMIECNLPQSTGMILKPKDLIQVTIQHVNARNNIMSIFMS